MITKRKILNNLIVANLLLKEIESEMIKNVENLEDEDSCKHYNSALINRNRIIINQRLKEIEK